LGLCVNNTPVLYIDSTGLVPYSVFSDDKYDLLVTDRRTDTAVTLAGWIPFYTSASTATLRFIGAQTINPDLTLVPKTVLDVASEIFDVKWAGFTGNLLSAFDTYNFLTDKDYKVEEAIYNQIALDYGKNNGYMAFLSCTREEVEAKFSLAYAWMKSAVDIGDIKIMTGKEIKVAITYQYTYYDDFAGTPDYYTITKTKEAILQKYHSMYSDNKLYFYTENQAYIGYLDSLVTILKNW